MEPRAGAGCEECLESGHEWIGLRLCLTCGHVGCCDASPHQHASKHFHATLHPIVEPFRSDEHWRWCYVDQVMLETPGEPWVTGVPGGNERAADSADPEPRAERRSGGLLSRVIGALHRDNYLVGVVDDPVSAERGANALRIYGFPADDVVLQRGTEIARRLAHPDWQTLVREATSEEGSVCREYNELARGGAILSVHTPTREDLRRACHIMTAYDAHSMLYFGDLAIAAVPAGEGCWM